MAPANWHAIFSQRGPEGVMENSIYLGSWTNWSHGKIKGLTLTVSQTWGDVIVAAIALTITFTALQLWGIVCFLAFQFRRSPAGDHVYHLVQAALRNSNSSPISSALRLLEISMAQRAQSPAHDRSPPATGLVDGFNHRYNGYSGVVPGVVPGECGEEHQRKTTKGRVGSTLARLSSLLLLAAAVSATSTTMSLLSARFFKAADNTGLIKASACGWPAEVGNLVDLTTQQGKDTETLLMVPSRARYQSARAYSRTCYAEVSDAELSSQCDRLVVPRIASTLTMSEACPFPGDGVCKTQSARIESGLIDSRDVLGINTPDQDRIAVKKSLTCAPIDADRWATEWVAGEQFGRVNGDRIKGYAVGTVPGHAVGTVPGLQAPESTYPFAASLYSVSYASEPYTLEWQTYMPGNDSKDATDFVPRDELRVGDADLTLIALSPTAFFYQQVPDPWFNVTVQTQSDKLGQQWKSPLGYSFLACLEQYQFCASGSCSQPGALYQLQSSPTYGLRGLTGGQKAVADLMWKSLWAAEIQYAMVFMGNRLLVANELVMGNWYKRSSDMPSNQWVTEAWNLANISLAALQRRPSDYAWPAPILQSNPSHLVQPETDAGRALCGNIKIRATGYTSFRIFSLAFLPAASALLAALNRLLPYYFSTSSSAEETPDWERYNIYHLVRSLCEARGLGPWDRREKTVPTMLDRDYKIAL
ncbi:hypothetical protein QBC43DRAFT_355491 [Cladorrhinum sp. PSN259]|nr:hypothetical protein QBC43DRAFT_355491 [Cladorrhinum sp. PSN259]